MNPTKEQQLQNEIYALGRMLAQQGLALEAAADEIMQLKAALAAKEDHDAPSS
jgi:hypothetical protein